MAKPLEKIPQVPMQKPEAKVVGVITVQCMVVTDPLGRVIGNDVHVQGQNFTDDAAGFLAETNYLNMAAALCAKVAVDKATDKTESKPQILVASAFPN